MRVPETTRRGVRWPRRVTGDFPGADAECLALTIDDGPTAYTEDILVALDSFGIHATFFVIGESAGRQPELVAKILEAGHAIGIHGWSHTRFPLLSDQELLEELRSTLRVLPVQPAMVRPPYGDLDERTLNVLQGDGLEVIGWTVHAEDWCTDLPRADLAAEIANDVDPGDIVLLHDLAGATQILERLLPAVVRRGLVWTHLNAEG